MPVDSGALEILKTCLDRGPYLQYQKYYLAVSCPMRNRNDKRRIDNWLSLRLEIGNPYKNNQVSQETARFPVKYAREHKCKVHEFGD